MRDVTDEIRYGFSLYPFAVIIGLGFLVSSTGPTLFQTLVSGMSGVPGMNAVVIGGILALQLLGAVVALAGFFGALRTILEDAER